MDIKRQITTVNKGSREGNKIKYLVIHDTGVQNQSAKNNVDYFVQEYRGASATYFVDNHEIWQAVDDTDAAWHCGDGKGKYGITNQNSIGIEMCPQNNGVPEVCQNLTIQLVKMLQAKYGIDNAHVVRHYDASRKNCPEYLNRDGKWSGWLAFKAKLTATPSQPAANVPNAPVENKGGVTMYAIYWIPNTNGKTNDAYYFNGVTFEHIGHPDSIKILKQIYKDNNGKDMPEYHWNNSAPWWTRLEQPTVNLQKLSDTVGKIAKKVGI